jgi:Tol biopolymer transport system component
LLLFRVNSTGAALQPSFRQITFRQGTISNARFGPDGQTILYSARWDAGPARVFEANTVSPESRQLPFEDDTLAGVSRSAELALLRNDSDGWKFVLSRIPLNGGAPLTVASGVSGADWAPDGKDFAVFRNGARDSVVEYPAGKVLYRSTGSVSDLRVSPTGDWLAFAEHPLQGDDAGVVRLLDRTGTSRELSGNWASLGGLAWAPSGKEVCFTAARSGVRHSVFCVTPGGKLRQVATLPGTTMLYDISKEGRVLLGIDRSRMMVSAATGGEAEHDISWFDWSHVQAISGDGSHLLFDETGEGGGPNHSVYLRDTRTASNVRLGDGQAVALSPDLNFALSLDSRRPGTLNLLSLTGGAPRTLSGHGIEYSWARCFPDGQSLLVGGHAPGKPLRLFVQPVSGGAPVAMTPDIYLHNVTISPDGRYLAGSRDRRTVVVPATGGEPRELALPFPAAPIEWTADGAGLYVRDLRSRVAARIARVDISRSSAKPWKELAPADKVGLSYVMNVAITPDGKSWAYSYLRELSELYVVDGWS